MATTPRSKMKARRRKSQTNSTAPTKQRSIKVQSQIVNSRSSAPVSPKASVPRQRVFSRKNSSINLPVPKKRQAPIVETSYQELSSLPQVSSSQTATPWWLMRLYTLYRYSCIGTFVLAIAVLVVYGWTVYSQKLWGQSYQKLQELQRDERQLTKTNEVLKNKMAQEAEKPNTGLSSPAANQTIFLPAESWEQKQNPGANGTVTQPQNQPTPPSSLGY